MKQPYTIKDWKAARRKAAYLQAGGLLTGAGGVGGIVGGAAVLGHAAMTGTYAGVPVGKAALKGGMLGLGLGTAGVLGAHAMRRRANDKAVSVMLARRKYPK